MFVANFPRYLTGDHIIHFGELSPDYYEWIFNMLIDEHRFALGNTRMYLGL